MTDLCWIAEYIELKEREDEDHNHLAKMLGVFLDKKDLENYFGSGGEENKKSGPLTNFFYPLAFALNHNYFEAIKKSFKDHRTSDIHKIYKAWRSGISIKEMQEQGILAPGIKITNTDDFTEIIKANLSGESQRTPFGELEVINLYNEDFDQDYLNFINELQTAEMAKVERKRFEKMKIYEGVDPSTIIDPFEDVVPKQKSGITINTRTKNG
jgi:hypothetical protein